MKAIIVGGVAGGATAATRLRRLDEKAEIIVIERTGYISYANCGLPYYIGGVIENAGQLTLQTPESFRQRFRIDVRTRQEVIGIDREGKSVMVRSLEDGTVYGESYDKLILSPGARPVRPNLPGIDSSRLFTLRTVEDTLRLRQFVEKEKPRSAVMVGGGFIGLETAENLRRAGVEVTIVDMAEQVMTTMDADMAALVQAQLRKNGINLKLGRTVKGFTETDNGLQVLLDDEALTADMALLAIGVRPETTLAEEAGLQRGVKNTIVVNDRMQTSDPDIYAVGDAVVVRHAVTGDDAVIALAGPANKEGRIAADNICGLDSRYRGSLGSSVVKLFSMTAASTGLTENAAAAAGLQTDKVVLSPLSHAAYYPGAGTMVMKVVFEQETLRLLGAQIVGYDGVDKRIDVLATAIRAGLQADRLVDLDLAYAPPYSSAKDPVNMAGYMIENIAGGLVRQFHWDEVDELPRDGSVTLLDVRTPEEFAAGAVEGFVNIPVDELRDRLAEIEPGKPVYIMCQSGLRSYLASRILAQEGYECYNFSGGYRFYAGVTREQAAAQSARPCGMDA
jgi:NADPH-dependent 2,4-dienoyl-CoA reductase/sulfur reductase-like enzyme/rhodanese-related sulfurtransferase